MRKYKLPMFSRKIRFAYYFNKFETKNGDKQKNQWLKIAIGKWFKFDCKHQNCDTMKQAAFLGSNASPILQFSLKT